MVYSCHCSPPQRLLSGGSALDGKTHALELAVLGARFFIGFLLVAAAMPKLADRTGFAQALAQYRAVPASFIRSISIGIPLAEAVLGVSLLLGVAMTQTAAAAAVLFASFAAGVSVNLIQGERGDCGCGIGSDSRSVSWLLVAEDIVLCGVCVCIVFFSTGAFALLPSGQESAVIARGDALAMAVTASSLLLALLLAGQLRVWGVPRRPAASDSR